MRDIRFRGKRKKDNKWIYGSLIKIDISKDNRELLGNYRCYIKDNDDKTGNRLVSNNYTDWRCYDVNPETVGQYTGLHDKNGKEIYESDLFKDELRTYTVFWCNEDARWKLKSDCGKNGVYYMKLDDHSCLYGEVIGNEFQCYTKI